MACCAMVAMMFGLVLSAWARLRGLRRRGAQDARAWRLPAGERYEE
jgi:hypothetical protein